MKIIHKKILVRISPLRNGLAFFIFLSLLAAMTSCKPKFYEAPGPGVATAGNADFTKYVAVGATASAGFMDNALYTEGQNNSFPNLIAQKLKEVNPSLSFV